MIRYTEPPLNQKSLSKQNLPSEKEKEITINENQAQKFENEFTKFQIKRTYKPGKYEIRLKFKYDSMKSEVQAKKLMLQQTMQVYEKVCKESERDSRSQIEILTDLIEEKEHHIFMEEEKVQIRMKKIKHLKDQNIVQKQRIDQMQDLRNKLLKKCQYISNFYQNAKYNVNVRQLETYSYKKDLNVTQFKQRERLSQLMRKQNFSQGQLYFNMNKYFYQQEIDNEKEQEKLNQIKKLMELKEESRVKSRQRKERNNRYLKLTSAFKQVYENFLKKEFNENEVDSEEITRKYQELQLTLASLSSQFDNKMIEQLQHQKEIEDLQKKLAQHKDKNNVNSLMIELKRKSSNKISQSAQAQFEQRLCSLFPSIKADAS